MQGMQVQTLVKELRLHMPQGNQACVSLRESSQLNKDSATKTQLSQINIF